MAGLMVVIFGLMGTGKTTLARALGEKLGWPVVHSDAVRKELAGLEPTIPVLEEFGRGIYSEPFSRKTYGEMLKQARRHLDEAPGVILDGSYKRAGEREKVRLAAREWGAKALFIYCECPKEVVKERLARRGVTASISDGRLELLEFQKEDFDALTQEDRPRLTVDTSREIGAILADLQEFIDKQPGTAANP
jgi:predicted kinase